MTAIYLSSEQNDKATMKKRKTIVKTVEIEISVPQDLRKEAIDGWLFGNNPEPDDVIIKGITPVKDSMVLVTWPESQTLSDYENFEENCNYVMGASIAPETYIVSQNWYRKLLQGKLKKMKPV